MPAGKEFGPRCSPHTEQNVPVPCRFAADFAIKEYGYYTCGNLTQILDAALASGLKVLFWDSDQTVNNCHWKEELRTRYNSIITVA